MRSGSRARITWIGSGRCWNASPRAPASPPRIVLDTEAIAACAMPARAALTDGGAVRSRCGDQARVRQCAFLPEHHRGERRRGAEAARPRASPMSRSSAICASRSRRRARSPIAPGMLFVGAMHRHGQPELRRLRSGSSRGAAAGRAGAGLGDPADRRRLHRCRRCRWSSSATIRASRCVVRWRISSRCTTRIASSWRRRAMRPACPTRCTRRHRSAFRWWRPNCCAGSLAGRTGATCLSVDAADPAEFAAADRARCTATRALWQTLRDNALERVRAENGRAQYAGGDPQGAGDADAPVRHSRRPVDRSNSIGESGHERGNCESSASPSQVTDENALSRSPMQPRRASSIAASRCMASPSAS